MLFHSLLSLLMGASLCLAAATPPIAARDGHLRETDSPDGPPNGAYFNDIPEIPTTPNKVQKRASLGKSRLTTLHARFEYGVSANSPPRAQLVKGKLVGDATEGTAFDDFNKIPRPARVTKLTLRGAERLDAITFNFWGTELRHGGQGGKDVSIEFGKDRYITALQVCDTLFDSERQRYRISYVKALTNIKRPSGGFESIEVGTRPFNADENCPPYKVPWGHAVVGVHGREGDEIDALGPIIAPWGG
ncbi:putative jacalin-like lectin domain protein [Rhizoctonia solani 123E]|uniref:Putative jacalin-like lectin domain protein n=1 Tax=Rhizoctonia solani 123E TaxID=1423351 RepID=A0A074RQC0_9AGAM|nr:putative jacalin-like lectin domain protein [Rhizoctonia solani 123E]